MRIFKFVITGGPCAGKTTALKIAEEYLKEKGFNVLTMNETATELIGCNINSKNVGGETLQKLIFRLQSEKEDIMSVAAEKLSGDTVILFDRGLLDGNAYIDNIQFAEILNLNGLSKAQIISGYDAVFHLASTAVGAEEYYTLANNSARSEDIPTARLIDSKTAQAWKSHPFFYYYDNSTDFDTKINRCIEDIITFINEH